MIGSRPRSRSPCEERPHDFKRQKSISTQFGVLNVEEQPIDEVDGIVDKCVDVMQHGVEYIKEHCVQCLQPQLSEDLPQWPESRVGIPHPNAPSQRIDLGMKFRTIQLDNDQYEHSVLEVEENSSAHQLKIRNGDTIHRINGSVLLDSDHHDVVNKFFQITQKFKLTLSRAPEDVVDGNDDDYEDVCTYMEIEVEIELEDDNVTVEIIAEWQREFTKNNVPKLRCYKQSDCYVHTATSDSTSLLSMTSSSSVKIIPAHIEDDGGQWIVYLYSVLWPIKFDIIAQADTTKYPSFAMVLYNVKYDKCLSISELNQLICMKTSKKNLSRLKTIDSHVFFKKKWVKGSDHIVFESAKYRDLYLAKSGKGVLLIEQKDSSDLEPSTKFKLSMDV
ncbi:uncharacterized protein LOC100379003 [Saccoglossus kowalevskii]|uniref:Uncharacterized protein LOC100379003 n=1 Tax=Saccoglossus kowalevskii TaxID=10224 RepID=A0ABM0LZL6_SACKO|nr:PREDICTED: uncharacterized protein LOC100379003 [Saccoglossus kowalevskii]